MRELCFKPGTRTQGQKRAFREKQRGGRARGRSENGAVRRRFGTRSRSRPGYLRGRVPGGASPDPEGKLWKRNARCPGRVGAGLGVLWVCAISSFILTYVHTASVLCFKRCLYFESEEEGQRLPCRLGPRP